MLRILPFIILLVINRTSILRSLTFSYYIIKNRSLSIDWTKMAVRLLTVILVAIYWYCTSDYIYCMDFDPILPEYIKHELSELKRELYYWQADTRELITLYEENGYRNTHASDLSEAQLRNRHAMLQHIEQGKDNVRNAIRDLAEFKPRYILEQEISALDNWGNTQPESSNNR